MREQASELSLALEWGLVDLDQVTRWADQQILDSEDVAAELCEVSLATDAKSALRGLNGLSRGIALWPSATRALQRILEVEDLSPRFAATLAKHVYFLGMRQDAPKAYLNLMHHWDYIDLAINGTMGTPEQATREFVQDVSVLVERLSNA